MEHLTDKLKLLKNIVPDDDFALSTKFAIVSAARQPSRNHFYTQFTFPKLWTGSVVMMAIVIVAIFIGNINPPNIATSVLELAALEQTAATFEKDISITLREIRVFDKSAEKTALALREASANELSGAIPDIATPQFSHPSHNTNQTQVRYLLEKATF